MTAKQELLAIIDWFAAASPEPTKTLVPQTAFATHETIAGLLGEPFPRTGRQAPERERTCVSLSRQHEGEVRTITETPHRLELEGYNWDELELTVHADGKREVRRTFRELAGRQSSTPAGAIEAKYFHLK